MKIDPLDHLALVQSVVRQLHRTTRALRHVVDAEDLAQAGFFGLVEACERFDPNAGTAFNTFARYRIHGAIWDWLRSARVVGRGVREVPFMHSLDALRSPQDSEWSDVVVDRSGPTEDEIARTSDELLSALARDLEPRDAKFARLYYVDGVTLREIARRHGLTESRVSQILSRKIDPSLRRRATTMGLATPEGESVGRSKGHPTGPRGRPTRGSDYRRTEAFRQSILAGLARARARRMAESA